MHNAIQANLVKVNKIVKNGSILIEITKKNYIPSHNIINPVIDKMYWFANPTILISTGTEVNYINTGV